MATPEAPGTLRENSPEALDHDVAELVSGNSDFAFDLHRAVAGRDANLFYSPYSVSLALALAYAGAGGETEWQMADTLRFPLPQENLHPAFNALDLALTARSDDADAEFRLNVANSLWGQRGHPFLPTFRDTLAANYGEAVREVDFRSGPEHARNQINRWASEATGERIKNLVPPNGISSGTRLILANAIYFDAAWRLPFEEDATASRTFFLLDGNEANVPMMRQVASFDYVRGDGYQAVELRYQGGAMVMTILLPDAGRFNEFENSLDGARWQRILEGLESTSIRLTMPKFEVVSSFSMVSTLKTLGMSAAFDEAAADFSGMDGRSCPSGDARCLVISDVLHRAFVSVDESGTEATAATALMSAVTDSVGVEPEPKAVDINRPFIFLVRDRNTGAILFLGRILKPGPPTS